MRSPVVPLVKSHVWSLHIWPNIPKWHPWKYYYSLQQAVSSEKKRLAFISSSNELPATAMKRRAVSSSIIFSATSSHKEQKQDVWDFKVKSTMVKDVISRDPNLWHYVSSLNIFECVLTSVEVEWRLLKCHDISQCLQLLYGLGVILSDGQAADFARMRSARPRNRSIGRPPQFIRPHMVQYLHFRTLTVPLISFQGLVNVPFGGDFGHHLQTIKYIFVYVYIIHIYI